MTRYEAFTSNTWRTAGMAQVVVARIRDGGRAEIGFFLVDLWCLGVKDAFLIDDGGESEFRELLRDRLPEDFRERLHPACAKKLIEGAVAYAESLGFAAVRDYRKAKRVLTGLTAADCPETFTYGRDGKPCYVEGPDDDSDRTARVIQLLQNRFGRDGFDYELFTDDAEPEETDDVGESRESLRTFFTDHADDGLDFYEFSGMVAALQICPEPVTPVTFVKHLWGPETRIWASLEEIHEFTEDVRVYWNYIADLYSGYVQARDDDETFYPLDIYLDDFPEDDHQTAKIARLATNTSLWCRGFIRFTKQWPEAWGDALTRTELEPAWAIIRAWADPEKPGNMHLITGSQDPADPTASSDTHRLPRALLTLLRALRPHPGKQATSQP